MPPDPRSQIPDPRFTPSSHRAVWLVAAALTAWLAWSYWSHGLVRVLVDGALAGEAGIGPIRDYVLSWGALAPAVYVAAVIVEVLVAPIPGTLLYAPGGAIFGGFVGGTLSLAGNVIGAGLATAIGRTLGEAWVARGIERRHLDALQTRLSRRALWVIVLLRANPLTSSDLVSYAAGAFGVPIGRVALGTLIGMAPLCYLQAYLAESLFAILPGSGVVILIFGVGYVAFVAWLVVKDKDNEL